MTPAELQQRVSDRAKVNTWLDHINETDPACRAEVLEQFAKDKSAREYYLKRYEEDCNSNRV